MASYTQHKVAEPANSESPPLLRTSYPCTADVCGQALEELGDVCVCACVCVCVCARVCVCVRVRGKALEELSSVMKQPLGKRFVQENTRRGSMGCPLVLTPVMSDLTQGHCGAPLAHLWASLPTLRHCHLPPLSLLCSTHTPPG